MDTVIPSRARSLLLTAAALAVLYAALFGIVGSAMFARAPVHLALAVTFDLTVTATAVVWWLAIRRKALPAWSGLAVLSWGVAAARAWVPHAPLGGLVAAGAVLDLVATSWMLLRFRRIAQATRAARDEGPIGALEAGLASAGMPARLAAIIATELVVVWLAITGWFRRPRAGSFSMRSTGWMAVAGVIAMLVIPETVAFHLLLAHWSPLVAWIATASSAYLLLWLVGDAHAIRLYPVRITGGMLRVLIGIRWRVAIPLEDITSVERITAVPDGALNLALLEPTVLVTLRAPVEVRGLLGIRRRGDRLALTIDDPAALIAALS